MELLKANSIGEIIISTIHNNTPVKKGEKIAGTRVIPLVIDENKIKKLEETCEEKIISVKPIKPQKQQLLQQEMKYSMEEYRINLDL